MLCKCTMDESSGVERGGGGSEMKLSPFPMPSQINTLGVGNVTLEHHGACGRENVFPFGKMVVLIHNLLSNLLVNPTTCGQW